LSRRNTLAIANSKTLTNPFRSATILQDKPAQSCVSLTLGVKKQNYPLFGSSCSFALQTWAHDAYDSLVSTCQTWSGGVTIRRRSHTPPDLAEQ
jgi:hypothetical protein